MKLIDFQRTIKYFDIDKGAISVVHMADNVKRYELKYGGLKFSFVDDGKNNDVLVSGDIANFKYVGNDNIFGISPNNGGIIHIQTREGFLLALITASHNSNKKGVGNYEEINAKIIGEILAEAEPFVRNDDTLSTFAGFINFDNVELRRILGDFDNAVNPFAGMTADMVDASKYPLNVGINGGKDKSGTWLEIFDLKTKSSTKYTNGPGGFSYRLNYIAPDKHNRLEVIHNFSIVSNDKGVVISVNERVVIRGWEEKKQSFEWDYDITSRKLVTIKVNPFTEKAEKTSDPIILPNDLQKICGLLENQATMVANEITGPLNPNHSRRR